LVKFPKKFYPKGGPFKRGVRKRRIGGGWTQGENLKGTLENFLGPKPLVKEAENPLGMEGEIF